MILKMWSGTSGYAQSIFQIDELVIPQKGVEL